jgi:hypothetical protein
MVAPFSMAGIQRVVELGRISTHDRPPVQGSFEPKRIKRAWFEKDNRFSHTPSLDAWINRSNYHPTAGWAAHDPAPHGGVRTDREGRGMKLSALAEQ